MQTRVGVSAIRALESIKGGSCLDGISLVGGQRQGVPGLLERSYVVLVPRFAGPCPRIGRVPWFEQQQRILRALAVIWRPRSVLPVISYLPFLLGTGRGQGGGIWPRAGIWDVHLKNWDSIRVLLINKHKVVVLLALQELPKEFIHFRFRNIY